MRKKRVVKLPEMFDNLIYEQNRKIYSVSQETGIPVTTIYNYKNKGIGINSLVLLKVMKNIARSDAELLSYIDILLDSERYEEGEIK